MLENCDDISIVKWMRVVTSVGHRYLLVISLGIHPLAHPVFKIFKELTVIIKLAVKSCPVGPRLHPSFDVSPCLGCCSQNIENLLNKDMKY
jgi:hypothetical protein